MFIFFHTITILSMESNFRSIVLLLLLIGNSLLSSATASPFIHSASTVAGEKVTLNLYYEALCLYSEDFIVNYLFKLFDNGLISIVDLKLSPYGNAIISSNGTIVCQHGQGECVLNTVEACAIYAWPVASDHFPFIYCVEKLTSEKKYAEWETCFAKLNLDPKPVTDCISSGFGHELDLQYADEINALKPPHIYVPWVVVDGQPLYDEYKDFISFVCDAYQGANVPKGCLGLPHPVSATKDNVKHFNHVWFKEDNVKSKSKSTLSEIIPSTAATLMHHIGMAESM